MYVYLKLIISDLHDSNEHLKAQNDFLAAECESQQDQIVGLREEIASLSDKFVRKI